jgi:benzoyl-CoA reductase subunit C
MQAKEIISRCLTIWRNPYKQVEELSKGGEQPIAFFCSYTPEELLHAAGLVPIRLMGAARNISAADAHLPAYCCSVARTDLDMALEGELDFLEGAVFVQTCDTMQRLSDIWRINNQFPFHGDLVLPVRMGEEKALRFLARETALFKSKLEEFIGREIAGEEIRESIEVYNHNRRLLEELYRLRREHPGLLTGLEGTACAVAGFWMRREEHNRLLEELLHGLKTQEPETEERTPLFISGSVCATPDLFELALELESDFIDDDFCCGHRYIEGEVHLDEDDLLQALARRLSERINCPCKHSSLEDRSSYLLQRAKRCNARGVVFFLQNFCEPYLFDHPWLKEKLKGEGIPSLLLESELQSFSRGQLRTRLQAFLEMIRGV